MFEEQCLNCVYKDASPSEGWCYLFPKAPTGKCESHTLDNSKDASVLIGIGYLQQNFPDKFND